MVHTSLLSLGLSLLLAASPVAATTTTTFTTTRSSASHSTTTTSTSRSTYNHSKPTTGPVPTAAPTNCVKGLQIFVVRGTDEPAGLGRMGVVAGNITKKIKDSRVTPIDYPATFSDYTGSVKKGSSKLKSMVEEYAKKCPNNKMALLGYSQGAQAVGDMICGTSSSGFMTSADLNSKYKKNIAAIVLYGDPTRAKGQSWNVGTATNQSSFFPRKNNAACAPYSANMRSWCDKGDRYCAMGNNSEVHGSYFKKYEGATTKWVVEKFGGTYSNSTTTSRNSTTTRTSSTSSHSSHSTAHPSSAATTHHGTTPNRPSNTGSSAAATSSRPSSGASDMSSSGGSSACFALALGLAYLLMI